MRYPRSSTKLLATVACVLGAVLAPPRSMGQDAGASRAAATGPGSGDAVGIEAAAPAGGPQGAETTRDAPRATVSDGAALDDAVLADELSAALAARIAAAGRAEEIRWLDAPGGRFLALYAPERVEPAKGAVLIVHGLGRHADWPGPVSALRRRLPAAGWRTLSIQLPAPDRSAPPDDQPEVLERTLGRIGAGLRFLVESGAPSMVLVGHRWGAGPAALFLEPLDPATVSALVALAPVHPPPGPDRVRFGAVVDALDIPVLTLVQSGAPAPPLPIRAADAPVRDRFEVLSIEPGLEDAADEIVKRVRAWLGRHVRTEEESPEG